jgi:hypothetical protein
MSERRKFMKGFGLLGAVLAGAATTKVVVEHVEKKEKEKEKENISHLAPDAKTTLVLQGNQVEKEPVPVAGSSSFYIQPLNHEYKNKVSMAVGKDDRLWIKVGEEWKRVSIES